MEHGNWLTSTFVYLAAALIAVPLAKKLGLGSIIGYLAAGIAIGPFGLQLVSDTESILHFAEFGVVLMLFLIGLELEPPKLWAMRRPIFGWGSVQLLGCAGVVAGCAVAFGVAWPLAVVAGLGLALSSTAVALQTMQERNLLPTSAGQAGFAILLLQDVAAIPILALIPLLGLHGQGGEAGHPFTEGLKAVAVIVGIVVVGRLLLRHALRWIARSNSPEIFTAAALGLVVGIACLMQAVGLSMALGAFLGGVLLAESEYKRELETDVEPFKGLLLGLFFMAVGMTIDFAALAAQWGLVVALLVGFLVLKAVVLWGLAAWIKVPLSERPVFVLLLAQGGEFAFVVFQQAQGASVLSADMASVLIGTVALSMLVTPLLLVVVDRWLLPRFARGHDLPEAALSEPQQAPVIIAGFGRYGQVIGRLMYANGLKATVLDHDAEQVEALRRFGFRVHYGDATRLDLLRMAGAASAKVLVVAIDDVEQSLKLVDLAREHFPGLAIVARARNVQHWYALRDRGVDLIERETLDSALMSGRSVLQLMGWHPHHARQLAMKFRRHSIEQLERLWPHHQDQQALVAMAKQGRQQLEELFAQEREDMRSLRAKGKQGWDQGGDDPT
ncbi:MAG: glutathione-regulated potassium-efflux system protein KefC [Rubrivivax sp.]|nr:MAG: glutathione-regulated potassium-efflux system protein KefC [Rubrivivax sp.]